MQFSVGVLNFLDVPSISADKSSISVQSTKWMFIFYPQEDGDEFLKMKFTDNARKKKKMNKKKSKLKKVVDF